MADDDVDCPGVLRYLLLQQVAAVPASLFSRVRVFAQLRRCFGLEIAASVSYPGWIRPSTARVTAAPRST